MPVRKKLEGSHRSAAKLEPRRGGIEGSPERSWTGRYDRRTACMFLLVLWHNIDHIQLCRQIAATLHGRTYGDVGGNVSCGTNRNRCLLISSCLVATFGDRTHRGYFSRALREDTNTGTGLKLQEVLPGSTSGSYSSVVRQLQASVFIHSCSGFHESDVAAVAMAVRTRMNVRWRGMCPRTPGLRFPTSRLAAHSRHGPRTGPISPR
ncbi:hypothetical protein C8T65DRAFT_68118 [Cerioporus squamosus]|nr:hypothetical protein C8T65DRAFT_68118 [Cerioporus squamosus]